MAWLLLALLAGCATPQADVRHELRVGVRGDAFDVALPLPVHPDGPTEQDWAAALRDPFGNGTAWVEGGRVHAAGTGQFSVEAFVLGAARPDEPTWHGPRVVEGHAALVSLQYDAVAPDGCWREASLSARDVDGAAGLEGPDSDGCA